MFKKLLKESINLLIQKHWLKCINKEIKKYHKYELKTKVSAMVIHDLVQKYNELYKNGDK